MSHTLYGCVDWNFLPLSVKAGYGKSHPVWVCGLKQPSILQIRSRWESHPVWVCGLKPHHLEEGERAGTSHPVWVCGLKRWWTSRSDLSLMSHPVWVCGLKPVGHPEYLNPSRHTLYGCVDWNLSSSVSFSWFSSHTLYGCVDWNRDKGWHYPGYHCHTLYGCVDWNRRWMSRPLSVNASHPVWVCGLKLLGNAKRTRGWGVTPCMGVWIETRIKHRQIADRYVTPCMGVWIETYTRKG